MPSDPLHYDVGADEFFPENLENKEVKPDVGEPETKMQTKGKACDTQKVSVDEQKAPSLEDSVRLAEAFLFQSAEPVKTSALARLLPEGTAAVLEALKARYENRGIELVRIGDAWAFRTASDLAERLAIEKKKRRKISRAAMETLAIVAYHQPVTRAEIEEIRGVTVSPGTLDLLFGEGWIEPKGQKQVPGRPSVWRTTTAFLDYFALESSKDLPGLRDLQKAGLLSPAVPIAVVPVEEDKEIKETEKAVEAS